MRLAATVAFVRSLAARWSRYLPAVRVALVVFVLGWILGPGELRSAVPIWFVFLIALGLEVNFLAGAIRNTPSPSPDRLPQAVDRQRYGYQGEPDDPFALDDEEGDEESEEIWADEEPAYPVGSVWGPVRGFLTGVAVIAVLAVTIWVVDRQTGWDGVDGDRRAEAVARFTEEASRIAGKPVTIRCDESRDYVGVVQHADGIATVGGTQAFITPEICFDLYRLAFEGETTTSQTARAIAVLAHEAWHLQGVRDEAVTECYALQSGVELGERLGLSESTARRLMRQQLVENALRGAASEYRVTGDCRDGGELDLDPADTRFP